MPIRARNCAVWAGHERAGWTNLLRRQGYRAVALSLRGHGASSLSKPLNSCSIADYADDIHAVAGKLGVKPVLIGHSMGCWVVLNYLATHGAPAEVLMAPGIPRGLRRWARRAGPTRLGGVNLGDLTHSREVVTDSSISDGGVQVSWLANGPDDGQCCPAIKMAAALRWDGSTVSAQNVRRLN